VLTCSVWKFANVAMQDMSCGFCCGELLWQKFTSFSEQHPVSIFRVDCQIWITREKACINIQSIHIRYYLLKMLLEQIPWEAFGRTYCFLLICWSTVYNRVHNRSEPPESSPYPQNTILTSILMSSSLYAQVFQHVTSHFSIVTLFRISLE
jgi:hypothetical protein